MTEGSATDDRARERVGHVLAEKWTLERLLGEGGMGAVYLGRHRNGARGAVKLLHPELARNFEIRERFLREGYAANRVGHPGAVQVLDDDVVKEGTDAGACYLVMELLEGQSLEDRLETPPPLTERELLELLDELLEVLEAAHANGVVHRDLKPANIFLTNERAGGRRVKVLDFGLARLDEVTSVTRAGLALGTPSFMSPEQASGRTSEVDGRTDLFALGATAFMIFTGRGLHEADGLLELVAKMGNLPAPKLREIAPRASEAFARVVDGAVAFRREDRYPDATAMRADVQAALASLAGADVVPSGPVTPTSFAPIPELSETRAEGQRDRTRASPPPLEKPARRRKGRFGTVLLLLLGGLAVATGLAKREGAAEALAALHVPFDVPFGLNDPFADAQVTPADDASSVAAIPAVPVAALDAGAALPVALAEELDAAVAADAAIDSADAGDLDAGEEDEEEEDEDAGPEILVAPRAPLPAAVQPHAPAPAKHARPAPHPVRRPTKQPTPKTGTPRRKKR